MSDTPPADFAALLAPGRDVRPVETGIWSVLPHEGPSGRYDGRARAYDAVIGSRPYNELMWGCSPDKYRRFAYGAVHSGSNGWLLDVGCGSLVFSAAAYGTHPSRPAVLLDQSLGMLREARSRLDRYPSAPATRVLLQADLQHLPFRERVFETVLAMGVLHLVAEPAALLAGLAGLLVPGGRLFLSSLVLGRRWGNGYLRLLHLGGEVSPPRTAPQVEGLVRHHFRGAMRLRQKGNMLFIEAGRT
jgi:SAM-dependent methyltransferase